jgi:riboflavin kinase/FMN adenylyltransferase
MRCQITIADVKIVHHINDLCRLKRSVFLATGFFDGVHLGHQQVLRRAVAAARANGGEAWAMTFDPHPLKILTPDSAPLLLTDTAHKLQLLLQSGIDGCLLIPFSRRFATTTAAGFLKELEFGIPTLASIFMGDDWRFGRQGQGDIVLLKTWATPRNITVQRVSSIKRGGRPISSTRIRHAVNTGKLNEATALLGRPFSILGTVVPGMRIGRKLGFPTANLKAHNETYPPLGIYAVQAIVNGHTYPGVVSFGHHPTLKRVTNPLLELHLLDTRMNLYRRNIEVYFLCRLRSEMKFSKLADLIRQIEKDIQKTRKVLARQAMKKLWIRTLQRWHPDIIVSQQIIRKRRDKERE